MRVTVSGASGLIGSSLLRALRARGDEVTALSRDPRRASRALGADSERPPANGERYPTDSERYPTDSERHTGGGAPPGGAHADGLLLARWDPEGEAAPAGSLAGRDAVVHLAGENVAQRWTASAKRAIYDSRVIGTRNLVAGLRACPAERRPRVLVNASAVGYYGAREDEPIDEDAPAGPSDDFLAQTCADWEAEAQSAEQLGVRVVRLRTGVVLDRHGGALRKMLPAFKLGVGGPVAGGRQYVAWIGVDDVVGMTLQAIGDERWDGAINATAPGPVTNRELSSALGRALHRPAALPVPGLALRLLYGEMAQIVTTGARVLPAKALVLGYEFRHPRLDEALRAALSG